MADNEEMTNEERDALKAKSWQAILDQATKPDLKALFEQPHSPEFIYYFLERFGGLVIYDAFNLEPPSQKVQIELKGMNEHYAVYDRGSCLVIAPKNLFSHDRTVKDGIEAAKALALEAFDRGWTVELVGFEKYRRAAWVELQVLAEQHGRSVDVVNYPATMQEVKLSEWVSRSRVANSTP